MPVRTLREFLDDNGVDYNVIEHDRAITAQEVAAAAHVPGRELAKTVMAKIDGELCMAVLRATDRLSLERLKAAASADTAELATEEEFKDRFPGCETGAMPPFGNLYDLPVIADERLAEDDTIAFNAGTHTEAFGMAWDDFERLAKPRIAPLKA